MFTHRPTQLHAEVDIYYLGISQNVHAFDGVHGILNSHHTMLRGCDEHVVISIENYEFHPDKLVVPSGTEVKWVFNILMRTMHLVLFQTTH